MVDSFCRDTCTIFHSTNLSTRADAIPPREDTFLSTKRNQSGVIQLDEVFPLRGSFLSAPTMHVWLWGVVYGSKMSEFHVL